MGVMCGDAISLIRYAVPYYKFITKDSTVKHLNNDRTYPSDDENELYSEGECAGDFLDASDLN
ncbi:hypothetical protein CROQUDRAFT_655321, partial [Cronartium quercuum f. sp. fusiforme G11]